ncbi:MAG TPA: DUF4268 domain-containing protein [Dehalococcoidia bacterium]
MIEQLGLLQRLDPRDVWQLEAHQFTPWLVENIGLLSQALGIEIELAEREVGVGAFSVDIFGKEVGTGREVLELLKIDDSLPAPNFRLVAQPSEWQKQIVIATSKAPSEKRLAYRAFFSDLLVRLKAASPGFTNASRVADDSWYAFAGGRQGFYLQVEFMRNPNRLLVQLAISRGDRATNKFAFDQLVADREQIEAELGEALEWRRLDDKKECRIGVQKLGEILSHEESISALKDWAVRYLIAFRRVLGPRIKALGLTDIPIEVPPEDLVIDEAAILDDL